MDPLSVGASVAGLLSAAGQVSNIVGKIIASKRGGSREINDIKTSVDTLHSVLVQIQLLLFDRGTLDPHRASMILVDQVKATLTECVLTFSELDGCVRGLEADEKLGILDSIRWALKAPALKRHLQKLEVHKTSLTLMMSILTW